jgi:hypothetical protein
VLSQEARATNCKSSSCEVLATKGQVRKIIDRSEKLATEKPEPLVTPLSSLGCYHLAALVPVTTDFRITLA